MFEASLWMSCRRRWCHLFIALLPLPSTRWCLWPATADFQPPDLVTVSLSVFHSPSLQPLPVTTVHSTSRVPPFRTARRSVLLFRPSSLVLTSVCSFSFLLPSVGVS